MEEKEDDLVLIDAILEGEDSEYAKIVSKYQDYAYTIAVRILNSREDAEEASQDAFIKAFHALKDFNRASKFSTWFYRIVFNTAISYKRKKRIKSESINEKLVDTIGGTDMNIAELKDRAKYIELAIQNLLPVDAAVISLFYLKEFSLEEIGKITGMKINAVKIKLFRARKRMASELTRLLRSETASIL